MKQSKVKQIIIAVGSTNPTKIIPVKEVFLHHFTDVKVIGVSVDSGVSKVDPIVNTVKR